MGLAHLCLSPPVSGETEGLTQRVCFGWVVREALQIPTALQGTEWVLGTGRGHLGQGTHGRDGAVMSAKIGAVVAGARPHRHGER